jgi:hypothetical protein
MVARFASLALSCWLILSVFLWPHNGTETTLVGAIWGFVFVIMSFAAFVEPPIRFGNAALGGVLGLYALAGSHLSAITRWHDLAVGLAFVGLSLVRSVPIERDEFHFPVRSSSTV